MLLLLLQWAAKVLLFAVGCISCSAAKGCYLLLQCGCTCCCCCCRTIGRLIVCIPFCPRPVRTHHGTIGTSQPTTVPARQDLFNQAHPGQRGSILDYSADANPQFGRESVADRLQTSQGSLSTNCSVTAPPTGADRGLSYKSDVPFNKVNSYCSLK